MSARVNLVCVGCGNWGRNVVRNFLSLDQANVLGFCRADQAKLEAMGREYPRARLYDSMARVVEDAEVEAVAIATPAPTHYDLALQALRAGKHVFVEKPMALRVVEAEDLVRAADQTGRVLMVGHLLEYSPAVRAIKEVLNAGAVGEVRHIHMERLKLGKVRSEENVLWSFAPHDISAAGFLLGPKAEPIDIRAVGHCYLQPAVEDMVHADLQYPGGVTVHIHVSWLHPEARRFVAIVGTAGMLVWDDLAERDKVVLHRKSVRLEDLATVDEGAEVVAVPDGEPLRNECQHYLDCILHGRTPVSDGEDGLRVVRALEAIGAALREQDPSQKRESPPA